MEDIAEDLCISKIYPKNSSKSFKERVSMVPFRIANYRELHGLDEIEKLFDEWNMKNISDSSFAAIGSCNTSDGQSHISAIFVETDPSSEVFSDEGDSLSFERVIQFLVDRNQKMKKMIEDMNEKMWKQMAYR